MGKNTGSPLIPMLGITAYSGTGKTTLLKHLIPLLRKMDIRVALIKHTHHAMEIDIPGKDSYELRKAGADQTIVASDQRWALITETVEQTPVDLHYLASRLDNDMLDLILVEGFKHEPINKIALYRAETGRSFDELIDCYVIAVASDKPMITHLPSLDINNPRQIAQFIEKWISDGRSQKQQNGQILT